MTYDAAFYDTIRAGCLASARAIVPRVLGITRARSVIDVGCGEGWWLSVFAENGCQVAGIDGDHVDRDRLAIPAERFWPMDLARDRAAGRGSWDLAASLEVAEHLPPGRADTFVEDLCSLSDMVLFSAAIPGQGGAGHINEQPPGYWVERFAANDYWVTGALRWEFWDNPDVENWYAQNLALCVARDVVDRIPGLPALFAGPMATMHHVVHPVLFDARRR